MLSIELLKRAAGEFDLSSAQTLRVSTPRLRELGFPHAARVSDASALALCENLRRLEAQGEAWAAGISALPPLPCLAALDMRSAAITAIGELSRVRLCLCLCLRARAVLLPDW